MLASCKANRWSSSDAAESILGDPETRKLDISLLIPTRRICKLNIAENKLIAGLKISHCRLEVLAIAFEKAVWDNTI